MRGYRLSPQAEEDLFKIFEYTYQHWGLEQAQSYIRNFDSMFEKIMQQPSIGLVCDDIRTGYRR